MLLGNEYELISAIAAHYHVHRDGIIRFSYGDFNKNFPNQIATLEKLINLGFLFKHKDEIHIDGTKWEIFFVEQIDKCFKQSKFKIRCFYDAKEHSIFFSSEGNQMKFSLSLIEKLNDDYEKTIYLCFVKTFDFNLFWLDLLNDVNLLEQFALYLTHSLTKLKFDNRIKFEFFDNVRKEYISEIFNVSLKELFLEKCYKVVEMEGHLKKIIHKIIKKDNYQAYMIQKQDCNLIILKEEDTLSFLSFTGEELTYNTEVKNMIKTLEKLLTKKITKYRELTMLNNNKVMSNVKNAVNIATALITMFNAYLLFAISKGLTTIDSIISNHWVIGILIILQVLISLATVSWLIIPALKPEFP